MSENALILASASPRRCELLRRLLSQFEVIPCKLAEPIAGGDGVTPEEWALALAFFKARAVADDHPGVWILGADTIVACAGEILGKPRDEQDARRMLEQQAERESDVITGVCLTRHGDDTERVGAAAVTRVWMRDDADVREAYLRSGDWHGKAGAYGIQNIGDRLIERIEGSFSNVVGLPLGVVARMLTAVGFSPQPVADDGFQPISA